VELDQKYDLHGKAAAAIVQTGKKAIDINNEYHVTEKVKQFLSFAHFK
jgi:hypothetical protein